MDELLEKLRQQSFRAGTVTLASGRTSDFFIDCKKTILTAEGHSLAAKKLWGVLQKADPKHEVHAVAGVALGGCPLASSLALYSFQQGHALDAIYVRKETKGHGTQKRIEGAEHLKRGTAIIMVEDVVTTGGSTAQAIEVVREAGLQVSLVLALVDRAEGGRERLLEQGVPLIALYQRADFIDTRT